MAMFRLAITPGEPAGIGYDLLVQIAQQKQQHELVVFGDANTLLARAKRLNLPLRLNPIDFKQPAQALPAGELAIMPITTAAPVVAGELNAANGAFVVSCLEQAINACQHGHCQALVTGPIQKSIINTAGIAFSGHTEFLQQQTGAEQVVMLLATKGLRVALATTHLPLSQVASAITPARLRAVIRVLHRDLRLKFGIAAPRILVCGLNPHAGEAGVLGREEIDIIEPVLKTLAKAGINCVGPLPADTLFTPKYLDHADAVLAMYHDQGLPVLKYKGFGQAVNITLGLPIIRTSVDHGTALDLAGTGKANAGSLRTAINAAVEMLSVQSKAE